MKQGGVQMDGGKDLELRDWLAGQALVGILMNPNTPRAGESPLEEHADAIAEQAYAYAEAMLRRRGTRPAGRRRVNPRRPRPGETDVSANRQKAQPGSGRTVPALSIRQPAAAALVTPPGPFELPGWETDYRGPLLIHAGPCKAGDLPAGRAGSPVYGALIGLVDLTDCVATEHIDEGPDEVGYVWVFANPRPFAGPVSYTGRMGMFHVAEEVVAVALAALKG